MNKPTAREMRDYMSILQISGKTTDQFPMTIQSDSTGRTWIEIRDTSKPDREPMIWSRLWDN